MKKHILNLIIVVLTTVSFLGCSEEFQPKKTVLINEIMAKNSYFSNTLDCDGKPSDWVEIFNWGKDSLNLDGLFISDSKSDPLKTPIPAYTLAPGELLTLFGGKGKVLPYIHIGFSFSQNDDGIFIFDSSGNLVDSFEFKSISLKSDTSLIRFPDGSQNWVESSNPTPSSENLRR